MKLPLQSIQGITRKKTVEAMTETRSAITKKISGSYRFSVAPMIDVTDTHFRYLARLLTKHTLLYTDMVTTGAILHGKRERLLAFNHEEHPVALQLGGSDPAQLRDSAVIAQAYGYDELNLNCGCPSDRVQSGAFGACLMATPALVRDCLRAMSEGNPVPVTLKCRTGIDQQDDFDEFLRFIDITTDSPCQTVIVHARNAWLQGLSPKENREIPPLKYDWVYRLKSLRPQLTIVINGGIKSLCEAQEHLQHVDGVMIGREAWHNTFFLADADGALFADHHEKADRMAVTRAYAAYCKHQHAQGVSLGVLTRHLLGLWHEVPGAKQFRRFISENSHKPQATADIIHEALSLIRPSTTHQSGDIIS
ncbi:MAG TPA: tRNA dihydrouridine(20/20a) synthase DusA [Pseudomonadales bacterium]|nr:tRNA dihydrouridine(20/20a) synthase DusA [Pseudomonadales bacterium]